MTLTNEVPTWSFQVHSPNLAASLYPVEDKPDKELHKILLQLQCYSDADVQPFSSFSDAATRAPSAKILYICPNHDF